MTNLFTEQLLLAPFLLLSVIASGFLPSTCIFSLPPLFHAAYHTKNKQTPGNDLSGKAYFIRIPQTADKPNHSLYFHMYESRSVFIRKAKSKSIFSLHSSFMLRQLWQDSARLLIPAVHTRLSSSGHVLLFNLCVYIIYQLQKCDPVWSRSFTALLLKYSPGYGGGGGSGAQLVFMVDV